jgi:hypothetical protein
MKRANLERARNGVMRVPRRQYGYSEGAKALRPTETNVIREAAVRLLRGDTLYGICMDFNARKIPSARQGLWTTTAPRGMLANPRLAGLSTYHGEVVGQGAWKPILTRRQSARIRSMLSDVERLPGKGTRHWFLLAGLVRCGRCGEPLRGRQQGTQQTYCCARHPGGKGCGRVSISVDELDTTFLGRLGERLDSDALPAALHRGHLGNANWQPARLSLDEARSGCARWRAGTQPGH